MAAATIDPKIIKKTQDTLGKIIKKPPLTEKHLSKPPFRYLHDMIMEVCLFVIHNIEIKSGTL